MGKQKLNKSGAREGKRPPGVEDKRATPRCDQTTFLPSLKSGGPRNPTTGHFPVGGRGKSAAGDRGRDPISNRIAAVIVLP
jgi:hypothetical protein